jgi:hypothetical protein
MGTHKIKVANYLLSPVNSEHVRYVKISGFGSVTSKSGAPLFSELVNPKYLHVKLGP